VDKDKDSLQSQKSVVAGGLDSNGAKCLEKDEPPGEERAGVKSPAHTGQPGSLSVGHQ